LKKSNKINLAVFLIIALVSLMIVLNMKEISPGVTTIQLVGNCEIEIYSGSVQRVFTAVFACPRTDMIRFWPLPVVQPWFEKSDNTPGKIAVY
jgi:hypothetical protein